MWSGDHPRNGTTILGSAVCNCLTLTQAGQPRLFSIAFPSIIHSLIHSSRRATRVGSPNTTPHHTFQIVPPNNLRPKVHNPGTKSKSHGISQKSVECNLNKFCQKFKNHFKFVWTQQKTKWVIFSTRSKKSRFHEIWNRLHWNWEPCLITYQHKSIIIATIVIRSNHHNNILISITISQNSVLSGKYTDPKPITPKATKINKPLVVVVTDNSSNLPLKSSSRQTNP